MFCLVLSAIPAYAQQREYQGGMNHTYIRKFEPEADMPDSVSAEGEEETPQSTVWKKYRALAAGEDTQKEEVKINAPTKPEKPVLQEEEQISNSTGIAALIEDYRKNKEQRSDMKSLEITKPKKPDVPDVPQVE